MVRELTHVDADAVAPQASEQPPAGTGARSGQRMLRRAAVVVGGPLLVTVTAVIVLVTQFQTAYLTNDDTVVASLLYGDYTGKRTSALVVVPALFGRIVRLGLAVIPDLPWYGISLYTLQIIGWTAIGSIFFTLRRRPPVAERIVAAATIVLLAPWMILRVGYTSTALVPRRCRDHPLRGIGKGRGRLGVAYAVIGGMFLGTTYILRANGLLALAAAFAPVFVIIGLKAGLRRCPSLVSLSGFS